LMDFLPWSTFTRIVERQGGDRYVKSLKPSHLTFETGKAYKMVLKNVDKIKHELDAPGFVQRVFTRKVEVLSASNKMLAEIKGNVREIEVAGGGTVEWFFVPVQTGKSLPMECAIAGHKEAGMVGTITIK
jgi:uncharacterized cupredoxin-like copper-binding protein